LRTRDVSERFYGGDSLRRGAISSVWTFTFTSVIVVKQCFLGPKLTYVTAQNTNIKISKHLNPTINDLTWLLTRISKLHNGNELLQPTTGILPYYYGLFIPTRDGIKRFTLYVCLLTR